MLLFKINSLQNEPFLASSPIKFVPRYINHLLQCYGLSESILGTPSAKYTAESVEGEDLFGHTF
jgi:hypothetical protein